MLCQYHHCGLCSIANNTFHQLECVHQHMEVELFLLIDNSLFGCNCVHTIMNIVYYNFQVIPLPTIVAFPHVHAFQGYETYFLLNMSHRWIFTV